jgi:hypothetical protein
MDLREIGWREWIELAQDRDRWRGLVNMMMNLGGSRATELVVQFKQRHVLKCIVT